MQGTRFELAKAYATEIFQIITSKSKIFLNPAPIANYSIQAIDLDRSDTPAEYRCL